MPKTLGELRDLLAGARGAALDALAHLPDETPVKCDSALDGDDGGTTLYFWADIGDME